MSDHLHDAMKSVLEGMGRAAREGRARRFSRKKPSNRGVDVEIGEVTLTPDGAAMDVEPDATAHGMSDDEMRELQGELGVQR